MTRVNPYLSRLIILGISNNNSLFQACLEENIASSNVETYSNLQQERRNDRSVQSIGHANQSR